MSTQLLRSQCWLMEVNVCDDIPSLPTAHPGPPRPIPARHTLLWGSALGRLGTHGLALVADTCRRCSRRWWCPKTTSDDCPKRVRRPPKHYYQTIPMAPPLRWSRPVIPLNPPHAWEAQGSAGKRIDTRGVWSIITQRATPCTCSPSSAACESS